MSWWRGPGIPAGTAVCEGSLKIQLAKGLEKRDGSFADVVRSALERLSAGRLRAEPSRFPTNRHGKPGIPLWRRPARGVLTVGTAWL
jgi:hypothetical protein